MADENRTEVGTLGEFGLIDYLTRNNETKNATTVLSVGDDCAVMDYLGKQTLVTTDMLVEGIHFDLSYFPLRYLGYKSVIVNLSDVYAMNGNPQQITVSLAFSNRFGIEALTELYEGIYEACNKYGVDLVGGDTTSSQKGLIISITAIGEVKEGQYVTRSGAKNGDLLCVSGDLGSAYLGFTLLEREKKVFMETEHIKPDFEEQRYIIQRILHPEARRDIIEQFEDLNIKPTAMMDISDGLSSEVLHICKRSGVGAVVHEDKIPIDDGAKQFAYKLNLDPTACALSGGEDYELLFTIEQKDYEVIKNNPDITVIGYITEPDKGARLITRNGNEHELIAQGWNPIKVK